MLAYFFVFHFCSHSLIILIYSNMIVSFVSSFCPILSTGLVVILRRQGPCLRPLTPFLVVHVNNLTFGLFEFYRTFTDFVDGVIVLCLMKIKKKKKEKKECKLWRESNLSEV